jgi:hypothetical protein
MHQAMFEAHVQFELSRFTGTAFEAAVRDEVHSAFTWLDKTHLADIATADRVSEVVCRLAVDLPVTEELRETVADAAAAIHTGLRAQDDTVGDVIQPEALDRMVAVGVGMHQLHEEILEQITENSVYARLVAHVVYHGIKSYVLTENVVARKVPGASSLVRLGQKGLSSAAPKLEQNIDAQLISFVNANIADTVRDSRRYLGAMLDEEVLLSVATEVRSSNTNRTVASAAELVSETHVRELADAGVDLWLHLRTTPLFARMVRIVVEDIFERYGDRTVASLLADAGVSREVVARELVAVAGPVVGHAVDSGYLEERIRSRLAAFYDSYPGEDTGSGPTSSSSARTS